MRPVTNKPTTLRRATARATLHAAPETIARLRANDLPKPDALVVARVAAVTAAKRTPDIIPYCHPIPVDHVEVEFDVADDRVEVTARVEAIWKTGVEMEALTAASVATLTLYDMLKAIDTDMRIDDVRLIEKRGGKSQFADAPPEGYRAAVIVASDGVFAGNREDRSGRVIADRLRAYGLEPHYAVIPDERETIVETLRGLCTDGYDLVLTTGGTGLGPRDVTVEAARDVIEREAPGIVEATRAFGQARTPYAMLSRGVAGVCGRTLVVTLPGSSRGAAEACDVLLPAIFHAWPMLRGGGHDEPRRGNAGRAAGGSGPRASESAPEARSRDGESTAKTQPRTNESAPGVRPHGGERSDKA